MEQPEREREREREGERERERERATDAVMANMNSSKHFCLQQFPNNICSNNRTTFEWINSYAGQRNK
jgi:hypothetical protein